MAAAELPSGQKLEPGDRLDFSVTSRYEGWSVEEIREQQVRPGSDVARTFVVMRDSPGNRRTFPLDLMQDVVKRDA
jgi:hypothetical protein